MGSNEMMDQLLECIHLNPGAAGFVDVPEAGLYVAPEIMLELIRGQFS